MNQPLSATETQNLRLLRGKIDAIVTAGKRPALHDTGVLGHGATNDVEIAFYERFRRLGVRLGQLESKVVVSPALPPAMNANTTITQEPPLAVQNIEVRARLVSTPGHLLTPRALVLVHEVSHALDEGPDFPVKDYAYRAGWAWGYLTPTAAAANADTFAEAAARLAELIEEHPGRYRVPGRIPAQCTLLRTGDRGGELGPALAWVELVVNRAWIRSNDCMNQGAIEIANDDWTKTRKAWEDNPTKTGTLRIEALLQQSKVIGPRYAGFFRTGLSDTHKGTLRQIHEFTTALKGALSELEPVPAGSGTEVTYDAGTRRLTVPYAATGEGVLALGERILRALIASTDGQGVAAFAAHRRKVIDWLVANDRPIELRTMQQVLTALTGAQVRRIGQQDWQDLAADLQWATLLEIRDRWRGLAPQAAELAAMATAQTEALEGIEVALSADIDRAIAIAGQLPGTKPVFQELIDALTLLRGIVTSVLKNRTEQYTALGNRLAPFK
ncbi:hypothetical protein [Kitasatospora viridis]|uniref:Uncharacterized protein n=1 Tax=Kitasatospora viridis TaxID=281105 RepID=A0A561TSN1_9ACTN|nr:hypothetical protein [Kitasatospora viridis]TWF90119.1 hypothetical protein FHX73_13163 [Kitasatospora viridis]